jgi:hypothetical protein
MTNMSLYRAIKFDQKERVVKQFFPTTQNLDPDSKHELQDSFEQEALRLDGRQFKSEVQRYLKCGSFAMI